MFSGGRYLQFYFSSITLFIKTFLGADIGGMPSANLVVAGRNSTLPLAFLDNLISSR